MCSTVPGEKQVLRKCSYCTVAIYHPSAMVACMAKNPPAMQETWVLVGAQYATRDQWRNNSRKNEGMEPKETSLAVDVTGDGSKVQCCKEQYYTGTWNVRSRNQGKLEVVKQEMASMNADILGIPFEIIKTYCTPALVGARS